MSTLVFASIRRLSDALFIDTGAWYALQVEGDPHHEEAVGAWRALVVQTRRLATTNLVVGETYTTLLRRRGHDAAWNFLDSLPRINRLSRHHLEPEIDSHAYAILRQYRDHDFSYVDATSFAFMRSAGITEAFAFDGHFATAGFSRIPLDRAADA